MEAQAKATIKECGIEDETKFEDRKSDLQLLNDDRNLKEAKKGTNDTFLQEDKGAKVDFGEREPRGTKEAKASTSGEELSGKTEVIEISKGGDEQTPVVNTAKGSVEKGESAQKRRIVILWTKKQRILREEASGRRRILIKGCKGSGKTLIMKQIALIASHRITGMKKIVVGKVYMSELMGSLKQHFD